MFYSNGAFQTEMTYHFKPQQDEKENFKDGIAIGHSLLRIPPLKNVKKQNGFFYEDDIPIEFVETYTDSVHHDTYYRDYVQVGNSYTLPKYGKDVFDVTTNRSTTITPFPKITFSNVISTDSGDISANGTFMNNSVKGNVKFDSELFNLTSLCDPDLDNLGNYIYMYGLGILIIIAVLLNGLQFAIFRTKPLRKYTFSTYLSAIAITDSFSLFSHIPRRWINVLYQMLDWGLGVTVYDTNIIACRGFTYFSYTIRFMSAWFVVALATDRLIVSKEPYRKSKFRKPRCACHALIVMTLISLTVNCHVIFTWGIMRNGDIGICTLTQQSMEMSLCLTIIYLIGMVGLPFLITLILTVLMLQNVHSNTWKLRPRKISISKINNLQLEKKSIIMTSVITGVHCVLSLPFIISWIVIIIQHFHPSANVCQYTKAFAAKDITEVLYMSNCALKFIFCVFFGNNILSIK